MCVRVRECVCVVHTRLGMPLLLHPSLNHLSAGPDVVVCDEGHVLRNCKSALSQAVNKVATQRRIVLTGTPLQNNLEECAWGQALSSLKWGSLSYTENVSYCKLYTCVLCVLHSNALILGIGHSRVIWWEMIKTGHSCWRGHWVVTILKWLSKWLIMNHLALDQRWHVLDSHTSVDPCRFKQLL